MADRQPASADEHFEQVIGLLLRAGVTVSVVTVSLGAILYLAHYGGARPDYRSFRAEPAELRSIAAIFKGAVSLDSRELIQCGLVLLLLTPVARVAFSVFAFATQRDRTYVIVTLVVLAILIASIAGKI